MKTQNTSIEMTNDFERIIKIFNKDLSEGRVNVNPFQPELTSLDFGLYEGGRFRYSTDTYPTTYERVTASFDENENKIVNVQEMQIFDFEDFDFVALKGSNIDEIKSLIKSYDHYTGAIDDGAQYREANERNKRILSDLAKEGVFEVTYKDLALMYSSPKDITFRIY